MDAAKYREKITEVLMKSFRNKDDSWFVPEDEQDAAQFIVLVADCIVAISNGERDAPTT